MAFFITSVSARQALLDQTVKWIYVKSVISMPNASTTLAFAWKGFMEMALHAEKFHTLATQILVRTRLSAKNSRMESMIANVLQEQVANTVKIKMLVFPILAKMMENAYRHVMVDSHAFVRTDTREKIANVPSMRA